MFVPVPDTKLFDQFVHISSQISAQQHEVDHLLGSVWLNDGYRIMFHTSTLVSQCPSLITVLVCSQSNSSRIHQITVSCKLFYFFAPHLFQKLIWGLRVPEVSTGPARRQMSMIMVVTVILNTKQPVMATLISLTFHIDIRPRKHAVLKKKRMKRKECARILSL